MSFRKVEFMFAYGMNTNLTSMMLRCRNAKCLGETILPNYRLDFRYHLDVTPYANSYVEGVMWELDPNDLKTIDQVEGYPDYYVRALFSPYRKYLGSTFSAWTYFMRGKPNLDYPDERYFNMVLEGYRQNKLDTDQLYQALDRVAEWKKEAVIGN
jgi:gamma-glutamylcyclotransferase (GGCT)/AIG2-like uncharacterized protein YtfP